MSARFAQMSPKYALGIAFNIGTLVLANPITKSLGKTASFIQENVIQAHPASDPLPFDLEPTSPSNGSITLPGVTSSKYIQIQCDGTSYGFDLDTSDCEEANAYLPIHPDQVQWAERNTGSQDQIFPLPYRAMGNRASCYVQPVLVNGATSAKAAPNEVRNAAAMIRDQCASGGKLQGGRASNIGGDDNLAVIMGAYKSSSAVQCLGDFGSSHTCLNLLRDMPATSKIEVFSQTGNSSTTVLLPIDMREDGVSCSLSLTNSSSLVASDTGSWYEVWEATTALWSVCTRHRLEGSVQSIGDRGSLSLALRLLPIYKDDKGPMALHKTSYYGSKDAAGRFDHR